MNGTSHTYIDDPRDRITGSLERPSSLQIPIITMSSTTGSVATITISSALSMQEQVAKLNAIAEAAYAARDQLLLSQRQPA